MPSVVANEGREVSHVDFLQDRFHLTRSEARVVVHLVQGSSLKSSAQTLGVTYETVRSYLKSAFLKTGTHRQAELVLKAFHVLSDPHGGTEESRPSEKVADARLATVTS
jgi:DNA-binding CsgD family transcriptional regulator